MTKDELSNKIEHGIDRWGLSSVLAIIASICFEKSESLIIGWQDYDNARVWTNYGRAINRLASKVEN
jgi:hypothetical protein